MNRRKIVKYMLKDNLKGLLVFFGVVMLIIAICGTVMMLTLQGDSYSNSNGWEIAFIIYLFCAMIGATNEYTKFFIQNGISRKTIFEGMVLGNIVLSLILTVLSQIAGGIAHFVLNRGNVSYTTLTHLVYGEVQPVNLFNSTIWVFVFIAFAGILGYAIGAFYGSAQKFAKVFASIFFPVFFFIAVPILDVFYLSGTISTIIAAFFRFLFGVYQNSINLWYSVGAMSLVAMIVLCIMYPSFIRRWKFK